LISELEQLAEQLSQSYSGATMDDVDLEMLARQLGDEAAVNAKTLADRLAISLQARFFEWARAELRKRKAARQIQSFDDLLTRLEDALRGERGAALRHADVGRDHLMNFRTPIRSSIRFSRKSTWRATLSFFDRRSEAEQSTASAALTFSRIWRPRKLRVGITRWAGTGARKNCGGCEALFEERADAFVIDGIGFAEVRGEDKANVFHAGTNAISRSICGSLRVTSASIWKNAWKIASLLSSGRRLATKARAARHHHFDQRESKALPLQEALARHRLPTVVLTANVLNLVKLPNCCA
jgi:hypothetical protein